MKPLGPPRDRMNMPFTGVASFLRMPLEDPIGSLEAEIAVIGIPTDEGSPFMPGSRFGPRSIREHSLRFVSFSEPGYFDPTRRERHLVRECRDNLIVDVGDVDVLPTNVEGTFDNITSAVGRLLGLGRLVVALGGDHAITYPVVRAFARDLHVLHLDAHLDYLPFVHGVQFTNGHAFRQLRRLAHVKGLTQVGIRSIRTGEGTFNDAEEDGNRIVSMEEFRQTGASAVAAALPKACDCYVSIDIDVLDMALVPGCVSAEPEGMRYEELRQLLSVVAQQTHVVGFDLVEVNPMLDVPTGITSYLAAHTVVEFLGMITDARRGQRGNRF